MAKAIDDALAAKTLEDLVDEVATVAEATPTLTKTKVEEALKYLKWQDGCSQTAGNEEYVGKGDKYICKKVGLSKDQLKSVKADRAAKVAELTPNALEIN